VRVEWYRHNGLGQPDPRITPHSLYLAIDRNDADRQTAYRALFRSELDEEVLDDIRIALTQGQPLGRPFRRQDMCSGRRSAHPDATGTTSG
jgi:putative transposase